MLINNKKLSNCPGCNTLKNGHFSLVVGFMYLGKWKLRFNILTCVGGEFNEKNKQYANISLCFMLL